jgi:hypothetical protein
MVCSCFDFWYGPAALTERQQVHVRRVATPDADVTRIAEPTIKLTTMSWIIAVIAVDKRTGRAEQLRKPIPCDISFTGDRAYRSPKRI